MRYRWAVLAAGHVSQTSFSALAIGLPVLVPTLREEYDLSLGQIGVVLGAEWIGALVTMLPWGIAADRYGERVVLALGLGACAAFLVGAAYAPDFGSLVALLALAGAAGASVNSASGRAVMHWFTADERGLALGVRQTAVPLGGLIAALALPPLISDGDATAGFLFFAVLCVVGAVVGATVIRGRADVTHEHELETSTLLSTLRDGRLWRLSVGAGIYVYSQIAVIGFGVVFLHDEHGLSERDAALVIAASQVLAVGFRIGTGRWSDVVGLADPAAPDGGRRHRRRAGGDRSAVRRAALAARPAFWRSREGSPWAGTRSRSPLPRSSQARLEAALRSASSSRS